jgi:hypothetical protein
MLISECRGGMKPSQFMLTVKSPKFAYPCYRSHRLTPHGNCRP